MLTHNQMGTADRWTHQYIHGYIQPWFLLHLDVRCGIYYKKSAPGPHFLADTWKVYLPESLPSLVRGLSITTITLIGYSAMGGAVGAGGLGDIAIRYGYHRYEYDVMIVTIVLLILIVQIIQNIFNTLAKKIDKRIINQ